jgi:hypothetical protein
MGGCTHPGTDLTFVVCDGLVDSLWVYGDDGDDIIDDFIDRTPSSYPLSLLFGGAGNDLLLGSDLPITRITRRRSPSPTTA